MKTLVYGCAFITPDWRDRFVKMANTMLKSLSISGYSGDVVMLSDKEIPIENAKLIITDPVPIRLTYPYDILLMRTRIWKYVDLSRYDYVLYVDCDTLINKPLDKMFEELIDKKALSAQGEGKQLRRAPMHQTELSKEEIAKYAYEQTWCTGIVGWPGDRLDFIRNWELACDICHSNDQTAFNAMVFRRYRGQVIPIPNVGYHCGSGQSDNYICHFYRQRCKEHYYNYFDKYIAPKELSH